MLGEYDQALEAGQRCRLLHPDDWQCLRPQIHALAALGRVDEISDALNELEAVLDLPLDASMSVLLEPARHLRFHGHEDAAEDLAARVIRRYEAGPASEAAALDARIEYGQALFLAGRPGDARGVFDTLVIEYPDAGFARLFRGFLAGLSGDTAQALTDIEFFERLPRGPEGTDEAVAWAYRCGVIYGALGDRERAWEMFSKFEPRWQHSPFDNVRVLYEPMRGYPPFEEMMRPKG
jgi:tetratricopeptide (TPR) repeat protein